MNNNFKKLLVAGLACAAVCITTLAAPHGGRNGHAPRQTATRHTTQAKSSHAPRNAQHAPKAQNLTYGHHAHARPTTPPRTTPQHKAAPKAPQGAHGGRPLMHHTPPPRPKDHRPCGRLHPRGHHIGGRHVVIAPPLVVIDSYYWTEEVLIDGVYYILYCYPDGTKRVADGTIFCYF